MGPGHGARETEIDEEAQLQRLVMHLTQTLSISAQSSLHISLESCRGVRLIWHVVHDAIQAVQPDRVVIHPQIEGVIHLGHCARVQNELTRAEEEDQAEAL